MSRKTDVCKRGHLMSETRKVHPNGDSYCSACKKERTKKSKPKDIEHRSRSIWKSRIKRTYGITEEQYLGFYLEQEGSCAICFDPIELRGKQTHIDHDHDTLEVRGLLCHGCNTAIGLFKESEETMVNAINYLKRSKWIR